MNKKNVMMSVGLGVVAVAAGTICHRVAPGLGLVLMPMFWPLAVLAAKVPAKYSVTTAAAVPFAAFLLSGMPAAPAVVAIKFAFFTAVASYLFRRVFARVK